MLDAKKIKQLTEMSGWRSGLALTLDWLGIVGALFAAVYFNSLLVRILCFLFIARQQLALAVLMHDGSHRRLFKKVLVNDLICQFFCGGPLFFSMYSYQKLHLKHHRAPLAADDPDLSLTGGYPISKKSFARKILRDLSGISYFKFIRYFIYMARRPKVMALENAPAMPLVGPPELQEQSFGGRLGLGAVIASMLLMNFMLWAGLFYFASGWFYLFFWFLPTVTVLQALLRVRGIAEHAGYQAGPDQRLNSRTVLNPVQTFIFAPHHVNFHIEHHVYPAVPFYNLPQLHRLMATENLLPAANVYRGYGQVVRELVR